MRRSVKAQLAWTTYHIVATFSGEISVGTCRYSVSKTYQELGVNAITRKVVVVEPCLEGRNTKEPANSRTISTDPDECKSGSDPTEAVPPSCTTPNGLRTSTRAPCKSGGIGKVEFMVSE